MYTSRAEQNWPPVVVGSVFQTGLNLMRDLLGRGVRTVGVDCIPEHEGFRSKYGKSYLCPDPDTHPEQWVAFMIDLAGRLGAKPVLIPAADMFVSAMGRHVEALKSHYTFSIEAIAVQAALATKEQQYALAERFGLPIPRTAYVQSLRDLETFASTARFPCLVKPRHQREWESLPEANPLRGLKLFTAETPESLFEQYASAEPFRPEAVVQEIVAGGDDAKFCYLSVYGRESRRLGHCVVRELRAHPVGFGSASVVEPVVDDEISSLCHRFLTGIGYVGICEIEVKRDTRDGAVRLIEANPRFSGTGDAAIYMGVEIGWLNYLDLIGQTPEPVTATNFGFRHITLRRDVPCAPRYVDHGLLTWNQILETYRGPKRYFDFDPHDPGPTMMTLQGCARSAGGTVLRALGLKPKLG